MKRRREEEPNQSSVEISFGTLFTVITHGIETDRVDCIIDVGEDNYFFAGPVTESASGKKKMAHVGTGGPRVFGKIVGQMSLDEVIEAFKEGARNGWVFTDEMEVELRKGANKESRILLLNE